MRLQEIEGFDEARVCMACDDDPGDEAMAAAHKAARKVRLPALRVATGLSGGPAFHGGAWLRLVQDVRDAADMVRRMEVHGEDSDWPALLWAKTAAARHGGVLVEAAEASGVPAGYIGFRRAAELEVRDGGTLAVCYSVRPDYVYLAPHARGRGLSQALRRAVLNVVEADLRQMERLREEGALDGLAVGFEVLGQVESDEGEAFLETLRQDVGRSVEARFSAGDLAEMGYEQVVPAF